MDTLNNRYLEALRRNRYEEAGEVQRYLFLDIDGVLNTIRYSNFLVDHHEDEVDEDGALFDPEAVNNLACIIENVVDLRIIISSTWRLKGWGWMQRLWKKRKLPGAIYSFTPVLEVVCFVDKINRKDSTSVYPYGTRALEVNEWLSLYAGQNSLTYKYVILDDVNDFLVMQQEHVIITDPNFGITKENVLKALEILP
jgi:hypothetical protein